MFFGYHLPNFTFPGSRPDELFDRYVELAVTAENAGFDMVTVMDHVYQIAGIGPDTEPMLEAYTALGALAARTSKVRLGTLVTGVTYRNPAMLAKQVTTLDVISRGRAVFGIGAAWNEAEHGDYGYEFPPIRDRMDRLEEAIQIARLMFTQERATFIGSHYTIDEALNYPRPIQAGGPPILVGGGGEQRTIKIAARYADITNWFGPAEVMRHKYDVLLRHCETVGRDPTTIRRTVTIPLLLAETEREAKAALESVDPSRRPLSPAGTPEMAAEYVRAYVDAGFDSFIFRTVMPTTPAAIQLAGMVARLLS